MSHSLKSDTAKTPTGAFRLGEEKVKAAATVAEEEMAAIEGKAEAADEEETKSENGAESSSADSSILQSSMQRGGWSCVEALDWARFAD